jgi:hypothetical protein
MVEAQSPVTPQSHPPEDIAVQLIQLLAELKGSPMALPIHLELLQQMLT